VSGRTAERISVGGDVFADREVADLVSAILETQGWTQDKVAHSRS
jgi:hypothetical protein